MNVIKIAMKCDIKHRAAIYTSITSMVQNKSTGTKYLIYLCVESQEEQKAFEKLTKLAGTDVTFEFTKEDPAGFQNMGKVIRLSWNTLVQGDLNVLYDLDLEDKKVAVAANYPDRDCMVSNSIDAYNQAVLVVDTNRCYDSRQVGAEEILLLPPFYNLGYEEILSRQGEFLVDDGADLALECQNMEELALVLRLDARRSPEEFFDTELDHLWLKYYKSSPIGDEPLNRRATMDNVGSFEETLAHEIPVLIRVSNESTYHVVGLIDSIKQHKNPERSVDIRLIYGQLSLTNQEILLQEQDETVHIALHCVHKNISDELLTTSIFTGSDKAIVIYPRALMECDISEIYDIDLEGNYICAKEADYCRMQMLYGGKYSHLFHEARLFDMGITMVNVKEWNRIDMGSLISKAVETYHLPQFTIHEVLNILCMKKRKFMPDEIEIVVEYAKPEEYAEKLESIVSKNPNGVRLIQDKDRRLLGEEEEMKDTLNRLNQLEKEKEALQFTCEQLRSENNRLSEDAGRYQNEITETRKSLSYRIGRLITSVPRMLRNDA